MAHTPIPQLNIPLLEKQIIELLLPLEDRNVKIIRSPDDIGKTGRVQMRTNISLRFIGETIIEGPSTAVSRGAITPHNGIYPIYQQSKLNWKITVEAKKLREEYGAYELIEKVRSLLIGRKIDLYPNYPNLLGPLVYDGTKFIDSDEGIWRYDSDWSILFKLA